MSLFPEFNEGARYMVGFGAAHLDAKGRYKSLMIDRALVADDMAQIEEAVAEGWIDADTRCFNNGTVVDRANERGAKKCAARLRELGWSQVYGG